MLDAIPSSESILAWIVEKGVITETGRRIELDDHYFMLDIFDDWSPKQAVMKSAQVGFSMTAVLKTFYWLLHCNGNIIYCVDEETELLSKRGWLSYDEATTKDEILTLNMKTEKSEWKKIEEVFRKEVNMDLTLMEGRNFSSLTTPNHRWPVKKRYFNSRTQKEVRKGLRFVETKDLKSGANLIPRSVEFAQHNKEGKWSNEEVELLAWIFTEGYYCKQKNVHDTSIVITQSLDKNKDYCQRIEYLIQKMGLPYKRYVNKRFIGQWRISGEWARKIKYDAFPNKVPSFDFIHSLTEEQLNIFVNSMVYGDGWISEHGTKHFTQQNQQTLDAFVMAAILSGYSVSISKKRKCGCRDIKLIPYKYVWADQIGRKGIYKDISYKGTIWCPRTKNGTFLAKRKNSVYWTGNTLPTVDDVRMFVPSKVNSLLQNNLWLQNLIGNKDSVEQKKVGNNFIWYKGTFVEKQAIMLSSSLNAYDEVDRANLSVIDVYSSRLAYSDYKGEWFFSNPSYPGVGVSKYFDLSDKKRWEITCSRCNRTQVMQWPESVDYKLREFICRHCKRPLSREDRRVGKWTPEKPGALYSGYHISQLSCPWVTAEDLIRMEATKTKEVFYNFYLGLPYVGSDVVVTAETILRNISTDRNNQMGNVMGVDQGLKKHYVIGNKQGIFKVGVTESWDEIEELMKKFDALTVIDALPDLTIPRMLRKRYPGRVYLAYYKRDRDAPEIIRFGKGDKYGTVYLDRNKVIQQVIDDLLDEKIRFNMKAPALKEFIDQWCTLYKVYEKDNLGIDRAKWLSSTGNDHFVHACSYWYAGMRRAKEPAPPKPWQPTGIGRESFEVTYADDGQMYIPGVGVAIFEKEKPDWLHSL